LLSSISNVSNIPSIVSNVLRNEREKELPVYPSVEMGDAERGYGVAAGAE